MKKALLSMAALSALAVGAPAVAQSGYQNGNTYPNGGYQNGYQDDEDGYGVRGSGNFAMRLDRLQMELDAGVRSGDIDRREAWRIRQQLTQLRQVERRYSVNGLTGQERADLQMRLRNVRQLLRSSGGYGQNGYGQDNGYASNGQYDERYSDRDRDGMYDADERIDANRDGYDDRDYNRNGRWDDQQAANGYAQPGTLRGAIEQVIGIGGLRVGQRATANLGAVPYEYRSQFRDSSSAYYRSDGRSIYRIDARSQTVLQVYPIGR